MKKDISTVALEAFDAVHTATQTNSIISLLTPKEKEMIGRRLLIVQAILSGKSRNDINEQIGISPNTYAQINRWLENNCKQYAPYIQTTVVSSTQTKRKQTQYAQPFSYEYMKQKYPMHFLLFNLVEQIWK